MESTQGILTSSPLISYLEPVKINFLSTSDHRSIDLNSTVKCSLANKYLLVASNENVYIKHLNRSHNLPSWNDPSQLSMVTSHKSPLYCSCISKEEWLVVSCSEDEVILSKYDTLLKNFSSVTIGVDMGKINSCTVSIFNNQIMTTLAKPNELILVASTSAEELTENGELNLSSIDIVATYEKLNENISWLTNINLQENLYVAGVSSGNVLSIKLWELNNENVLKLIDHRMGANFKSFSDVEYKKLDEGDFIFLLSPDGHVEVFLVSLSGLSLVIRTKIEDPFQLEACGDGLEIDYRIISFSFFHHNLNNKNKPECFEDSIENEHNLSELNNTLTNSEVMTFDIPKILIVICTTSGVAIYDLRGGQIEFMINYADVFQNENELIVSNAKCKTLQDSMQIICIVESFLKNEAFTFLINPIICRESVKNKDSFVPSEPLTSKSVLKKKLKSPPPPPTPQRKKIPKSKIASSGLTAPPWSEQQKKTKKTQNCSNSKNSNPDGLSSARAIQIQPKSIYSIDDEINFEKNSATQISTLLSDNLSYMRMRFSTDGKNLAVGASSGPLIIFKTVPQFEAIEIFKDMKKVTGVDFSFCSKYLLVCTNNGNTDVIRWRAQKQLLSLNFNSKFNEHSHAQFYYMDKFILQPEDNSLSMYCYRVDEPNSVTLKAGSFHLHFQKITAIASPNKFYSNTVMVSGSNKCLLAFDVNTEQISMRVENAHSKPINTIRINEAPKGANNTNLLSDLFLTSTNSHIDPIKLWDFRQSKCVARISDINPKLFVGTSRANMSPCGRYISSGFEEKSLILYDVRRLKWRVGVLDGLKSPVLDTVFDNNHAMLWAGCRNGTLWNFN